MMYICRTKQKDKCMKTMIFIYKTKRRGNLNSLFATLNFDKNDPIYYMDI